MSIRISKNSIRATGKDANALFIAMNSTDTLLAWEKNGTGSPQFQRLVKEAIAERQRPASQEPPPPPSSKSAFEPKT